MSKGVSGGGCMRLNYVAASLAAFVNHTSNKQPCVLTNIWQTFFVFVIFGERPTKKQNVTVPVFERFVLADLLADLS